MTDEKWQEIIFKIEENFGIEEKGGEEAEKEGGETIEFVVFSGPLGKMKLERVSRPIVIDKKTTYSRRIGGDVKVDYVYSPTEKSHKIKAYKWDENQNDWLEIEAGEGFTI